MQNNHKGQKRPRQSFEQPKRPENQRGESPSTQSRKHDVKNGGKRIISNSPADRPGRSQTFKKSGTPLAERIFYMDKSELAAETASVIYLQDFTSARGEEIRALAANNASTVVEASRDSKVIKNGILSLRMPSDGDDSLVFGRSRRLVGISSIMTCSCCREVKRSSEDAHRASAHTDFPYQYGMQIPTT
jgi:hypothetical protein